MLKMVLRKRMRIINQMIKPMSVPKVKITRTA